MNPSACVASGLPAAHRQEIALKALSRQEPITHLAQQEQVSRKFVYHQRAMAQEALTTAFEKPKPEEEVLYHLP